MKEDIRKLIDMIINNKKVSSKTSLSAKTYEDELILVPASGLKNYLPEKYRQMRQIASRREGVYYDTSRLFYEQGKFMEDFEEDYSFHGNFARYFPTYRDLTDSQLRGYFSWRTKIRRGEIQKNALPFVFIYMYELLNGIGVSSAEDGFIKLKNFWQEYRTLEPFIDKYAELWLKDYVIYYNLDKKYLEGIREYPEDEKFLQIKDCENQSAGTLFEALCFFSAYNFKKSAFYKKNPRDVIEVTVKAFFKLRDFFAKNRKTDFTEYFFGKTYSGSYSMFNSAVFYFRERDEGFVYELNPVNKYRYNGLRWTTERFFPSKSKKKLVGDFLRAVDFYMRGYYGFSPALQEGKAPKLLSTIIKESIDEYISEKKERERKKIRIDTSILQEIRETSAETCKKLIVDEEYGDEDEEEKQETEEKEEAEEKKEEIVNETPLTDDEYYFLRCLLYSLPYDDFVREKSLMVSVLADGINEKMFDLFSDTVIMFDGDKAEVIEDYTDELKEVVRE